MSRCEALSIPELEESFWIYFAAFMDGEGSITMCQNGPRMIVSNTYLPTLEWFKTSLGCGYLTPNGKGNKQCYNLTFGSNAIRAILPKLIPHLREKRHRAEVLLEYMHTVVPRGGEYHTSFSDLRAQVKINMLAG